MIDRVLDSIWSQTSVKRRSHRVTSNDYLKVKTGIKSRVRVRLTESFKLIILMIRRLPLPVQRIDGINFIWVRGTVQRFTGVKRYGGILVPLRCWIKWFHTPDEGCRNLKNRVEHWTKPIILRCLDWNVKMWTPVKKKQ